MILDEKFEILKNPGWGYWVEHMEQAYKNQGWTHAEHDMTAWKTGFGDQLNHVVLVEKSTKKFIGGVISGTFPSPRLLGVGMYFLLPQYRGLGLATALWDSAIAGDVDNKVLAGAEKMSPKYALRDGYDKFYEAVIKKIYMNVSDIETKNMEVDGNLRILNFSDVDFEKFVEFDRTITGGLERTSYLKSYLMIPGAYNKVVTSQNGQILGYCNIRECIDKNLVAGPFYAVNSLAASTVLRSTLESIPNLKNRFKTLKFLTYTNNHDAKKLYESITDGKTMIDESKNFIQFTKYVPKIPAEKIYSVTELTVSYC